MCAAVGLVAPVQQPQVWQPPAESGPPVQFASSAASWVGGREARPTSIVELAKARNSVRRAARIFIIVGGISMGLGLVAELGNVTVLLDIVDWGSVVEGAIFLALAFFAWRGSLIAIGIGTGLYALDTVLLLLTGHFSFVRILVIVWLGQSFLSAITLRQHAKRAAAVKATAIPPDQARAA
jgi:hypothetical protein